MLNLLINTLLHQKQKLRSLDNQFYNRQNHQTKIKKGKEHTLILQRITNSRILILPHQNRRILLPLHNPQPQPHSLTIIHPAQPLSPLPRRFRTTLPVLPRKSSPRSLSKPLSPDPQYAIPDVDGAEEETSLGTNFDETGDGLELREELMGFEVDVLADELVVIVD